MIIDKKNWLWGLFFAFLTLLFGALSPVIQFEYNHSYDFYQNVIWDFLYGIGYEIGYAIFHEIVYSRSVGLIGFFLWPVFLFLIVAYFGKKVAGANWVLTIKLGALILFLATLLFYVPVKKFNNSHVPSFTSNAAVNF